MDYYSNNNLVADNIASYLINGTGLGVAFSNNNTFTRNIVSGSRDGLILSHAVHTTVSGNIISSNRWRGVALWYSVNNTISDNAVLSNGDGLLLEGSNLNTIVNNSISNIGTGIEFYSYSNNNTFTHNSVYRNLQGVYIHFSSNNTVVNNTISDNTGLGASIVSGIGWRAAVGNRIYHNHFLDNSKQAYDHTDTNQWDDGYPNGGNYWSDYKGADFYGGPNQDQPYNDGIGDTPYLIHSDGQDRYPLVSLVVPSPPTNLTTQVVNFDDIHLHWLAPSLPSLHHYLIYRSTDQRNFDFSDPLHNTSSDPNPLWNNWLDIDAASPGAPKEYYYAVRAVSRSGGVSSTSNTAGKWTRTFSLGLNSFALPLEPFKPLNISWFAKRIPNVTYIRWMDSAGHWVTHHKGSGVGINDTPVEMGKGYEIYFTSVTDYSLCGYPASMIRFHEGLGDSASFSRSLSAQVTGSNVTLSWLSVSGAEEYRIYRSSERYRLHDSSSRPIDAIPATQTTWIDFGVLLNEGELHYMIIPVDSNGRLGSSSYSIGVITQRYQSGASSFALPLKPVEVHSLDWYCDEIKSVVGMGYMINNLWKFHAREMPGGVYDSVPVQAEGYQLSLAAPASGFVFVGF